MKQVIINISMLDEYFNKSHKPPELGALSQVCTRLGLNTRNHRDIELPPVDFTTDYTSINDIDPYISELYMKILNSTMYIQRGDDKPFFILTDIFTPIMKLIGDTLHVGGMHPTPELMFPFTSIHRITVYHEVERAYNIKVVARLIAELIRTYGNGLFIGRNMYNLCVWPEVDCYHEIGFPEAASWSRELCGDVSLAKLFFAYNFLICNSYALYQEICEKHLDYIFDEKARLDTIHLPDDMTRESVIWKTIRALTGNFVYTHHRDHPVDDFTFINVGPDDLFDVDSYIADFTDNIEEDLR